jgi:hypothetical protein
MFSTWTLSAVLLLAATVGLIWLGVLRHSLDNVIGDEGTFMAMAASLAEDGDLRFDQRDEKRIRQQPKGGRWVVILQQTASGLAYSKPAPFPILAAPFQRLFGEFGLVLCNGLALALALALAFEFARRLGPADLAALTAVTFVGASCVMSYVVWRISDSLQLSMALAGLVLCVAALRPAEQPSSNPLGRFLESSWAAWIGAVVLGVVAVMRYPNALLGVGASAAYLVNRRWRRGLAVLGLFGLSFLGTSLVNWAMTGAAVPYKAKRTSFNIQTGYPVGVESEESEYFATRPATQTMGAKPTLEPRISLYSALYFFVGRHTGLLVYFSAALILLGTALWRPDRTGLMMLAAGLGMAAFYIVYMPRNYFGGEGFVGNRYFLGGYAALFVALPRLPRRRWLLVSWVIAVMAFGSAAVSVISTRDRDQGSQSHAYAGVFRLLPYESTASAIDGRRDRYWSDEFQRFVDPFAKVGRLDFRLQTGEPAAEIQVANQRQAGVMRFLINTNTPHAFVEYRDWQSRQEFEISAKGPEGDASGVVEILPSPAWRQQDYWFAPGKPFLVRNFRLALRTPDGSPAQAEVHYLGRYHRPYRIYDLEVLELDLPTTAEAGTTTVLPVQVRNDSRQPWNSERVLPVFLGYLLRPLDGGKQVEGEPTPMPEPVKPGKVLATAMTVHWPSAPGDYDLVVDLRIEGVAWFREQNGEPLAQGVVSVLPRSAEGADARD